MIWFVVAASLVWFVGFGISMRKQMTRVLDKSYQDTLDCHRCDIYRRSSKLKQDTCLSHQQELYPSDVVGCIFRSVLWPASTGWWLARQAFTRTFYSRSGKIRSKVRDKWQQEVRSLKAERELEAAEAKLKELEQTGEKLAALTRGEPTAAEIRDVVEHDNTIRRMRQIRGYY